MRIKSYFASSVQSAISIARKEFGDDVTLVTSHTAPLESRHLGDYEVVFAVDETPLLVPEPKKTSTQVIKSTPPVAEQLAKLSAAVEATVPADLKMMSVATTEVPPAALQVAPVPFDDLLQAAIATPLSTEENVPEKLERVRSILLEMGIDGPMVRALMTMIERSVSAQLPTRLIEEEPLTPAISVTPSVAETEPTEPEPVHPAVSDLTPAELAFYLSVSVGS